MPKITSQCPICSKKNIKEVKHLNIGKSRFITLDCGHTYKETLSISDSLDIQLLDGKVLYPYQVEGVHFAERSSFNCLIGDEQGLGKTIQALGLIHLHMDELKPILIVVKAGLTVQWQKYILQQLEKFAQIVTTKDKFLPNLAMYIISYDTAGKLEPEIRMAGIKTIILDECQMIKNHDAKRTNGIRSIINITKEAEPLKKLRDRARIEMIAKDLMRYHGIADRFELLFQEMQSKILGKCECRVKDEGIIVGNILINKDHAEKSSEDDVVETILHEIAHAITPGAGHIDIWRQTSLSIGGNGQASEFCDGSIPIPERRVERVIKNKIFLSGTPIKNNAIEFWPSLNLLRPEMFPNRADWLRYDVGYWLNSKGTWKPGGLKYPEKFKEKTKDFIIRRERQEVFPELPPITRDFRYHEISTDEMRAYALGVKKLADFLKQSDKKSFNFHSQLQGHIMILRHITGLAKINPLLEYVDEMIEDHADEPWKLAIFHHHIDVGDILEGHIKSRNIGYTRIVSSYSATERYERLDKFRNDENCHIMTFPSLAASEGFDLDFCSNGVILEREWNPANEEQVEGRFIRATREMLEKAKMGDLKVNILYPVAVDTIDEFFAELVERKRQFVRESLSGKISDTPWNESQIMLDLAEIAIQRMKAA